MLFRAKHKLSNSGCKALGEDEVFTAEGVLADEKAENFYKVRI